MCSPQVNRGGSVIGNARTSEEGSKANGEIRRCSLPSPKESMVEGVRTGLQSGLAKHFKANRQRVHQVVVEERTKIERKWSRMRRAVVNTCNSPF